ncbi:hypothetical protein HDE_13876 [Halotydeus destructor]|nr:hypothetical protein HDE_13876 [Halotydeus destructor]
MRKCSSDSPCANHCARDQCYGHRAEAAPLTRQCARSRQVKEIRNGISTSPEHWLRKTVEKNPKQVRLIPQVTIDEIESKCTELSNGQMVGHGGSSQVDTRDRQAVNRDLDSSTEMTSTNGDTCTIPSDCSSHQPSRCSLSPARSTGSSVESVNNLSDRLDHCDGLHSCLTCPESQSRKNSGLSTGQKSVKLLVEPMYFEEIEIPSSKEEYITRTRYNLGLGIPSGILTVMASVSRIQATQQFSSGRRLSSTYPFIAFLGHGEDEDEVEHLDSSSGGKRFKFLVNLWRKLISLKPLSPTFACLLSVFLLLTLAAMTATTNVDHNGFVLGLLLAATSCCVIGVELVAWTLSLHWLADYRSHRSDILRRTSRRASSVSRIDDTF